MKRLLPSITYWNRLEPSPRSNDLLPALAGAVGDGLWCLTRQWQFGEFEALNGGSAAWIEVATTTDRLSHRAVSGNLVPLDPVAPLETLLAEHRTLDVATAVDLGQFFEEMLAAAGHGHHANQLRGLYPVAGATKDEIAEGDEELLRFRAVVAGRALDGGALYHAARISPANALAAATFDAASRAQITTLLQQFVAETREFLGDRFPPSPSAWQAERLEYELDVVVRNTGSLFTSRPGPNGELTWDTLAVEKPQLAPAPFEARTREVLTLLPSNVRVRGQQTSRWWDFDHSAIDFGVLDVEPQEAAKLIVTDYIQQQGGDWYVVPVEQPVGTLMHIDHVLVRDVFGALISVPPARDAQGRPPMFTIGGLLWTTGHLLVPSAADIIQFGNALEEVRFVRDDMLNMVWAVEETIEGPLGRPVSGRDRARRRIAEEPSAGTTSFVYRTSTVAPEHWVPFVPVTRTNEVSFERVGDPAGSILRPAIIGDYRIAEEELRRSGLRIRRCAARCRDARGGTRLWIMRQTDVSGTKETPAPRFDPLIPREVVEVTPEPEPARRVGTSTTLIQSTFGLRGNFEVIVPAPDGGFAHYVRDNDDPALPWRAPVFFASDAGPIDALSLIQSRAGNLTIVARVGERLALFRQDGSSREWSGPEVFATGVAGSPSFIERLGGALEVVAPLAAGGLVHFTRNPQTMAWSVPMRFALDAGRVDDVALVESASGRLELVARVDDRLAHLRHDVRWSGAMFFTAGVSGAPSFIQSRTGARNFEVVAPSAGEGLLHFSGNPVTGSWGAPVPFGRGTFQSAALIQSNFNDHFEVIARQDDALIHFRSRPVPLDWREAGRVGPKPPEEPRGIDPGGSVALIQSTLGTIGNFEVVVAARGGGLAHYWRDNDDPAQPWRGPSTFAVRSGRADGVSLIQNAAGDLEVIARFGQELFHFRRDASTLAWSEGELITSGVRGTPSFVQRRAGSPPAPYELVTPLTAGGIGYFRRADLTAPWSGPAIFAANLGLVDDVSLIESNSGTLEVIARIANQLAHFSRVLDWSTPVFFATGVSGNPSLLQGRFRPRANLEVVAPSANGGMIHLTRDHRTLRWSAPVVFDQGAIASVAFLQGNIDRVRHVIANAEGRLVHYWREPAEQAGWNGPGVVVGS